MPVNLDHLNCPGCGYALRGLPGNVCPECGQEFDADALLNPQHSEQRDHAAHLSAIALVLGAASVPATIVLGLDAVSFRDCGGCCRSHGPSADFVTVVFLAIILLGPCIACVGMILASLPPRIVARLGGIGVLAMVTSWVTLFVILATAR